MAIIALQRGIPSKRKSSACVDYVPALCTHRPSLLPIEWLSEASGLARRGRQRPLRAGKLSKLGHLEEVKVVTRSPLVNQRRDHYRVAKLPNHCERYPYCCCGGPPPPPARGGVRRSPSLSEWGAARRTTTKTLVSHKASLRTYT